MTETLRHRGPDGSGMYFTPDNMVALGHCRLSFLDLTDAGKQPMSDTEGNIRITFNGEIYNFRELREELQDKYLFTTRTDTEVLLAAYHQWGIDFINRLKGMFAFAILDENRQKLYLVRDRFGIKPLYYSPGTEHLLFASELKAIIASGKVSREVDYSSVADYFIYRYIPSPKTIWKNVCKLPPAHYAEVDIRTLNIELIEYWKLPFAEERTDENDLIRETNEFLQESVRRHILADVPVGSFLSGGYDSSAIVHYMTKIGESPETFSVGFEAWENSEHTYAQIVARHLKVRNETLIAGRKSLDLIDRMPDVFDEPIADISIIPTYLVSQLAGNKVKAVLSGEGADELFGGYTWQKEFFELSYPDGIFQRIKARLSPPDTVDFYARSMAMGWFDREELKKMLHPELHAFIPEDIHWFYRKHFRPELSPLKSVQYLDIRCFMGELVLTKIDRASMANSLEVRVPFLDHVLFEKFFAVDEKRYFKKSCTKYILQKNLKGYLPEEILLRKKQGFVGPDSYYMDIEWYKKLLEKSILVRSGIIRQAYIDDLLQESYNWKLWKILVLEKWFEKWVSC